MSGHWWRWLLFGLAIYGVFLCANLPATYLVKRLNASQSTVQLTDIEGTLWSGDAGQLQVYGAALGNLQWRFDWLAPFTGNLGYRFILTGQNLELRGRMAAGPSGKLVLRDITGYLPVSVLDPWLPLPSRSVTGTMGLQLAQVVLVRSRPTLADGELTLRDAQLNWPESALLGNFRLQLQADSAQGIQGVFADTGDGPLLLQGNVDLRQNGHYELSGTLAPRHPDDAASLRLLQVLGPPDANGKRHFQYSGQI